MREMHEICAKGGIKLNRTISYQLTSNRSTEGIISVLTNTLRAVLYNTSSRNFSGLRRSAQRRMACPQPNTGEKTQRMDTVRVCQVLDRETLFVWRALGYR